MINFFKGDVETKITFDFDWDIVNAIKSLPERRYDPTTKAWYVPNYLLGKVQDLFPYEFVPEPDEAGKVILTITGENFKMTPENLPMKRNPSISRITYFRRARDALYLEKFLNKSNVPVELRGFEPNTGLEIKEHPTLYPFQSDAVEFLKEQGAGIVALDMGLGKAQPLDTPLLTTDGFKTISTVNVGDFVYNRYGKPVKVTGKSEVWKDQIVYNVHNTRGAITKVHENHEWLIKRQCQDKEDVFTTKELWERQEAFSDQIKDKDCRRQYQRPIVKIQKALEFSEQDLIIDPYILGYWLGDGSAYHGEINGTIEDYHSFITNSGLNVVEEPKNNDLYCGKPRKDNSNNYRWTIFNLISRLEKMNLVANKHIPDKYLFSSKKQRIALLQGLMDSDGNVTKDGINEFSQAKPQITHGLKFILDSLGIRNGISRHKSHLNGERKKDQYKLNFKMKDAFRLERKRIRATDIQQRKNIYIEIEKTNEKCDMQCIQVDDPEHIYLTDYQLLPTKNSIVSLEFARQIEAKSVMVVAPGALINQWNNELKKHFGYHGAVVISGKIQKKKRLEMYKHPFVIVSYDTLKNDILWHKTDALRNEFVRDNLQYDVLVLDEVQKVKNWKTQRAEAVSKIIAKYTIGLTGTPIENKIEELYFISDQIVPAYFGSFKGFQGRYITRDMYGQVIGYQNLEEIYHNLEAGLMFRRLKDEVELDLPDIVNMTRTISFNKHEKALYKEIKNKGKGIGTLAELKVVASNASIKGQVGQLSSKERELFEMLGDELYGRKVIVFTSYKKNVKRLCDISPLQGINFYGIHGGMGDELQIVVEQFNNANDERGSVLYMTDVGMYGLNLQSADVLINFDLPWNPAYLKQRQSRIHRIGSEHKSVLMIDMVSENTIDEHIQEILNDKELLLKQTIDGVQAKLMEKEFE